MRRDGGAVARAAEMMRGQTEPLLAIQHDAVPEIGLAVFGKARQRGSEQRRGVAWVGAAARQLDGAVEREFAAEIAVDIKPGMLPGGQFMLEKTIARPRPRPVEAENF